MRILPLLIALSSVSAFALPIPSEFRALNQQGLPILASDFPEWSPRRGGSLRLQTSFEYDLVAPSRYRGVERVQLPAYLDNFVFEPLMWPRSFHFSETIFSGLVRSVTYLKEERAFLLHVDPRATFSDGTPVTARDVVSSYENSRDHFWNDVTKDVTGPLGKAHDRIMGPSPEVRSVADHDVYVRFNVNSEIELRRALYAFLTDVSVYKKVRNTDPRIEIPDEYIGTGPYRITRITRDFYVFTHRADYWYPENPIGNFDEIKVYLMRDQRVARQAFMGGELNFWDESSYVMSDYMEYYRARKDWHYQNGPRQPISPLVVLNMNMTHGHMRDVRFRRAMMLALDDETMANVYKNMDNNRVDRIPALGTSGAYAVKGWPSLDVLALMKGDANAAEASRPFEDMGMLFGVGAKTRRERLRLARQSLEDAGYKLSGNTLVFNGKPVELSVIYSDNPNSQRLLEVYRENLLDLGIELKLDRMHEDAQMQAALGAGNWDFTNGLLWFTRDLSHLDPSYLQGHFDSANSVSGPSKGWNRQNWQSPTVDKILADLQTLPEDDPKFKNLMDALLRLVSANVPFIFLGERNVKEFYVDRNICLPTNADYNTIFFAYWDPDGTCPTATPKVPLSM